MMERNAGLALPGLLGKVRATCQDPDYSNAASGSAPAVFLARDGDNNGTRACLLIGVARSGPSRVRPRTDR